MVFLSLSVVIQVDATVNRVFRGHSHLGNGRPASIAALGGRGVSQSMIDMSGVGRGNHVHSMIDGHAPSMMGTHMSHMEPVPSSFHVSRTDMYNGNYPHLQVGVNRRDPIFSTGIPEFSMNTNDTITPSQNLYW